ncbi:MAG: SRPBCC family protein [Flavobacteriaceae bacterium]|uniref:SRPBCC family protein n=1 Tax=Flagellimonas algarum TaxID=3230298 RepID=UPI0033965AE5|nr:SRPBCC family protein [Flavobacteriaceae bacterium]
MHIEIPKKAVAKSSAEVFEFLTDIKNFEILMPENTEKFEILDERTFRFALSGMPEIILRLKEQTPNSHVVYGAASDKLPFRLNMDIASVSDTESEVSLGFEGKFNAMMAMMIKRPITNFMETLASNFDRIGQ